MALGTGRATTRTIGRVTILLALMAGLLATAPAALAATITVSTTADQNDASAPCSLREAIISANSNSAFGGCATGSAADTIVLPAGTYTLAIGPAGDDAAMNGDLDIQGDLTILGAGPRTTIVDGADLDRVFDIDPAGAGITVQISDFTVRNGTAPAGTGGGIRSQGALEGTRVAVTGNAAPNGGGISTYSSGALTLRDSLVSGNRATSTGGVGGGVELEDSSGTLSNVTITENAANANGGGIWSEFSTTALSNVTVGGNRADEDGDGDGDGGGLYQGGTGPVTARNTILGDNDDRSTGANPMHDDCSGSLTSQGYNLISDLTGCTIGGDATGNVTNQKPQLSGLVNNGGPTDTHALKPNSPAMDAGNPALAGSGGSACEATDQRGLPRSGSRCDMGAYEGVTCLGVDVNVVGTAGNDVLTGTATTDGVMALTGDDVINAGGGKDAVCGGEGNDTLRGQEAADQLVGDSGNDRIAGGPGDDVAKGLGRRDRLRGQADDDVLSGGAQNDRLDGGKGADRCRGGPGRDRIRRCE